MERCSSPGGYEYGEIALIKYKELFSLFSEFSKKLSSLTMRWVHFERAKITGEKDEIEQNRKELFEISDWFNNQSETLDQKFEKYLRID